MGGNVHSITAVDFKSDQALWTISVLFAMAQRAASLDLFTRFSYLYFLRKALLLKVIFMGHANS